MGERAGFMAKNTIALYFRMLFTLGVGLYCSRVVLNILGIDDFGIYNIVGGVIGMLAFINSSMAGATQRFLTFELGKSNKFVLTKTFNLSITIHILIAAVILVLTETIGLWLVYNKLVIPTDRLDTALWVFHSSVLASAIGIITVPYVAIINAHEKMNIFAYISILEVVLRLGIVFLLPLFPMDKLQLYGILTCAVSVVTFLVYFFICTKLFEEARVRRLIWDSRLFKRMIVFSGWVLNGNLAVVGYTQGVSILLNLFFGPAVNAARGIATQVQNAVNNFSYNFQRAMNPQIIKSYAANDLERMHRLIYSSTKITFFLLFIVCIPIYFDTHFVLLKWLKQIPPHTVVFVQLSLLISLVSSLSYSLIVAIHSYGDIKRFQLWEGTILLMILPASYVLLKNGYPAESTLIIHLLFSIVAQVARVLIVRKAVKFHLSEYFHKVIFKIIITVPFCLIVPFLINENMDSGWLRLGIMTTASIFSVCCFGYLLALGKDEKIVIHYLFNKIILGKTV
ncbi:lipopolysaccharide biosynthesis protein [Sphingobacterium sp. DN00404]|uniref:Lipopolysaccharide biosynthesis protein n=1 Tax=Sphingobacterium micropteri TaxID=2763501 RepID=A0ABR7YLY1_9SPHI|nr:lipopolysaccharide biosynthesis protein [Sphingobacterium micropteri]MBD1432231.1 lipopolysaccharide biosynthesis protein [Sphingobacterium micropteri]